MISGVRVLIFIGSLTGGGAERTAVSLSRHLVERGYRVTIATMHHPDHDFFVPDRRVRRIGLGLAAGNRGFGKVTATLRRIAALRSVIRDEKASVVIGLMTTSAVFAVLACVGTGARAIASERNFPGRKSIDRPWRLLRKLVYRFASAHVAQTRETASWLARNTGAKNIHVIPNSVAWPVENCPPALDPSVVVDDAAMVVLSAGTKPAQKGFDVLVEAFARVAPHRPDWHLVVLGLGSSDNDPTNPAHTLGCLADGEDVRRRVHFPGRVGNMTDWYRRAAIFAICSRYEGFPNVLLEAMAAGCPSVATDCETGPRDIVRHEVDGFLVAVDDVGGIADRLGQLMDDEDLRNRFSRAARAVRERFSEAAVFACWDALIDDLASRRRATSNHAGH